MHQKIFDGMYFAWVIFVIYRVAAVQGQPCFCDDGCDNSTVIFPGSGGRIVNVAYGKEARSTSRYTDGAGMSGPACLAVNGKTSTWYYPLNYTRGRPSCIHTSPNDGTALWQVDLGRNYTVTNITIYRREPYRRRMAGLDVTVDDQLCHTFPNSSDTAALDVLPEQIDIICSPPLTGRVVKLQKNGQHKGQPFINVCEVQVWACKDGLYGAQCDQTCSGHCQDNVLCDNYYGTCPPGCTAGTHGFDCRQQCGQCDNSDTCNTVTGLCPHGCLPGWKGDNCKQEALSASKLVGPIAGAVFGGLCVVAVSVLVVGLILRRPKQRSSTKSAVPAHGFPDEMCQNGRYGEQCSAQCGHCIRGQPCNKFTGTCAACQPHFQSPFCKVCTGNRYGASCELNCSTKCGGDGSCEKDSGRCVDGCIAGYRPGESGFCNEVCEDGKYGKECSKECGKCTDSCRHDDGFCIGGCLDGFERPLCAQTIESSSNLAGPVAGGLFGGLCVIALSILVGLLIRRSRNRFSSETVNPSQTSAVQGTPVELRGQVIMLEETGRAEESDHYDELQTPDDSDRALYLTPVFNGKPDNARNSQTFPKLSFEHQ